MCKKKKKKKKEKVEQRAPVVYNVGQRAIRHRSVLVSPRQSSSVMAQFQTSKTEPNTSTTQWLTKRGRSLTARAASWRMHQSAYFTGIASNIRLHTIQIVGEKLHCRHFMGYYQQHALVTISNLKPKTLT